MISCFLFTPLFFPPLFSLEYIYIVFVLAPLSFLFSYSSFLFTPFSSYVAKNGLTLPFLILSRSGSLKCPLFVGLQPPPSHRLLRSQWDSSHPNPFSDPFHTHMHSGRIFFTHSSKRTFKSMHAGMRKHSIQQLRTHIHTAAFSAVSQAPHTPLPLQKKKAFIHP